MLGLPNREMQKDTAHYWHAKHAMEATCAGERLVRSDSDEDATAFESLTIDIDHLRCSMWTYTHIGMRWEFELRPPIDDHAGID